MRDIRTVVDDMVQNGHLTRGDLELLLTTDDEAGIDYLKQTASDIRDRIYGKKVYVRGLIEVTNYCKNDCLYCGIRHGNCNADRYRLDKETILGCAEEGYKLGFRTFVLQGGEDPYFTDERVCEIVRALKEAHPDCAVTLSLGEKSKESYAAFYEAGADRYLLRHETADEEHYNKLHPEQMSFANRIECLHNLKDIGFQTGCGFMVGSPGQTIDTLYKDLCFIKELEPQMVGIGPFIPQKDTPFGDKEAGTLEQTLRLLSIIRIIHPKVLLPSTTALGTISKVGRELGIKAGGNVVMPNLSPESARAKYTLYDNKAYTGGEAAECISELTKRMNSIGYEIVVDRGDYIDKQ